MLVTLDTQNTRPVNASSTMEILCLQLPQASAEPQHNAHMPLIGWAVERYSMPTNCVIIIHKSIATGKTYSGEGHEYAAKETWIPWICQRAGKKSVTHQIVSLHKPKNEKRKSPQRVPTETPIF